MKGIWRTWIGALVLAGLTAGPVQAQTTPPAPLAASGVADPAAYTLGPGDEIHVQVFGEDDLSGIFPVDGSGMVRLPLIGQMRATGATVRAFENMIEQKLESGKFLVHPNVSINVTKYRPFYILGEVRNPGEYSYVNGMNLLTAVALAGGYTYRADTSSVYVRANGSDKEVEEPATGSTPVRPGDIIRVRESFF